MKKLNRLTLKITILIFIFLNIEAKSKIVSLGAPESKVTIKVFSSLTCPACANFHSKIFSNLKKDFIDKGLVRFEHHPFPLDLAALNAEIILRCYVDKDKKFVLLDKIYEKQQSWAVGSDINKINDSIKKIGLEVNLENEKMNSCLKNDKLQDEILTQRIEAQKKYKIEATPTIFINEKEYTGKVNYKEFKKTLEKNL
tara:strand:- start:27 stop:620 length:594 start_codon:yes stop_codon:yes gene_type:complete